MMDRGDPRLREQLDAVVDTYIGERLGDQIRAIAALEPEFAHRIRLVSEAIPAEPETRRFTCFDFALDLRWSTEVTRIAANQPDGSPLYTSPQFVRYLIAERLDSVLEGDESPGDLVIYSADGLIKHAGILVAPGLVISKWGMAHLWIHGTLEVPARYGTNVRYFRRLRRRECVEAFLAFVRKMQRPP